MIRPLREVVNGHDAITLGNPGRRPVAGLTGWPAARPGVGDCGGRRRLPGPATAAVPGYRSRGVRRGASPVWKLAASITADAGRGGVAGSVMVICPEIGWKLPVTFPRQFRDADQGAEPANADGAAS